MNMMDRGDERILVLAPVGRDAELIHRILAQAGLNSVTCSDLLELQAEVLQGVGALLLTEEILTVTFTQGLKDLIASQPTWSDLPLVLLLKNGRVAESGLVYQVFGDKTMLVLLERPVRPPALVTVLQSLLQARRRQYQMRDLLDQLAQQNEDLQTEVGERERLFVALAQERAQLQALAQTLEKRVKERTRQVRSLAARLSLAEHRERKRVSQILHDHVQQMLYGVQWRVYLLELSSSSSGQDASRIHLEQMKRLADEAIHAARTLSVELSPPILANEGLPEAIAWLASHMKEIHGIKVAIDVSGDCQIVDPSLRIVFFQILRELLFNVVKHAEAQEAYISLRRENGQLVAMVRDEGIGFDVTTFETGDSLQTGLGLSSIRERLDLFGGSMAIHSQPSAGTEISIFLPLAEQDHTDREHVAQEEIGMMSNE